jgi:subtilisin family serine protease
MYPPGRFLNPLEAAVPRRYSLLALASGVAVVASFFAVPSAAAAAPGPYRLAALQVLTPTAAPGVQLIPGRYIVTTRLSFKAALSVREQFSGALQGFVADLTPAQVNLLKHNADVLSIEQDAWHHNVIDTTQANPPSWGIDRADQVNLPLSSSYTYTATGAGVHAYIIDTGVDPTHANFGGRATFDFNAIDSNNTDCNSHGTHVAGTIGSASYGVAKGVRLHGVKWLDCNGSGTTSAAISAVNWVTANKIAPAVANTSWNATYSATLATALTNMMNSGVFLATSGGNTGANSCDRLPRNLTAALVVAATTSTDARASYSSTGPCIDIYGPGSSIISTVPGGGSGSKSGTSMSTPHATGIAALYKQTFGNGSQATVHAWFISNASNGVVTGSLSGTPNRLLNKRTL